MGFDSYRILERAKVRISKEMAPIGAILFLRFQLCPERDLNPHTLCRIQDFKSNPAAISECNQHFFAQKLLRIGGRMTNYMTNVQSWFVR